MSKKLAQTIYVILLILFVVGCILGWWTIAFVCLLLALTIAVLWALSGPTDEAKYP